MRKGLKPPAEERMQRVWTYLLVCSDWLLIRPPRFRGEGFLYCTLGGENENAQCCNFGTKEAGRRRIGR